MGQLQQWDSNDKKEKSPWGSLSHIGGALIVLAIIFHLKDVNAASSVDLQVAGDGGRNAVVQPADWDVIEQIRAALDLDAIQSRLSGQMAVQPPENKGVEGAAGPNLPPEETVTYVEDYFGFGPATKIPVACYTQEFDSKAVKPPEKTVVFRNNPSGYRNGVAYQNLQIRNLVFSDCQMRQVKLLKQKYPAFYEVTLTFLYKRADGVIGTLVVERRIGATFDDYQHFRPGAFPIYPGDQASVNVITVPGGSEKAHQEWLKGGDMEFRLVIGDFARQPCSSAEIRRMMNSQTRVDLGNAKAAVGSY